MLQIFAYLGMTLRVKSLAEALVSPTIYIYEISGGIKVHAYYTQISDRGGRITSASSSAVSRIKLSIWTYKHVYAFNINDNQ